ncbi:MAG: extracellular solute-binding protein [Parvibaculaceae bacterium]
MRPLPVAALIAASFIATSAHAAPRHGLSVFGDLKYPPDFKHFDYVNPDAPKGGRIATMGVGATGTFDTFNAYILRGDSAQGVDALFDSLMARAEDEPDAVYGLVAETADLADDKMSVSFKLRPEARFSDGTQITSEDVCNSFSLLKEKGHPNIAVMLRDVTACRMIGGDQVRYEFKGKNIRDLPTTVAALPIFSKAYYDAHPFDRSTLEPPLGSGPYKIGSFKQGSFVAYERRDDYWAKDLPVNKGRYNFDEVRILYFRDRTAGLEALKAGVLDLREEFSSRSWATEYNVKAVTDGRLIKADIPDETITGAQGFFLNMRREKFADPRVRRALDLAFDFEWSNANLFYGLYERTQSFFENSTYKAEGKPSPDELKLLEPLKADLTPEVFGDAYLPPISDKSGQDRKLLRQASQLLTEAGWKLENGGRVNAKGQRLSIEFLLDDPTFERILGPYVRNLRLIGIDASIRQVESAQYEQRQKEFDFDIIVTRFGIGQTPGTELLVFFDSKNADAIGSANHSGLKSTAVDSLIETVTQAKTRDELTIAARTLDRTLRATHFWVPQWHKPSHWVAYWDLFGKPDVKPKFNRGIIDTWWSDPAKASTRKGP